MKKIKIIGAFIFIFSVILAFMFNYTEQENTIHKKFIKNIKDQKDITQDISKHIFYIYRNKDTDTTSLTNSIKSYLKNINNRENELHKDKNIIKLWNNFYLQVQHFRENIKIRSTYSNILLEKNINDIYNINLKLIIEFNKVIKNEENKFSKIQNILIKIQYILFATLVLLLLYLFTQLKSLVSFVQDFLFKSKDIIKNSSIKELKPINIDDKNYDVFKAENNFNTLVSKINISVKNSTKSIEHSHKTLEILELHVEELLDFIYDMNNNKTNNELRQKEDAIIQSLEELSSTKQKLKNLENDLNNLISH